MTRKRRRETGKKKKPVKIRDSLHSALKEMQREFKKCEGVEPALGDLVEKAFEEDPVLEEVLREKEREEQRGEESTWDEEFMRL